MLLFQDWLCGKGIPKIDLGNNAEKNHTKSNAKNLVTPSLKQHQHAETIQQKAL